MTRQTILAAAARRFAERGYEAVSVREIARVAGVDPGLVRHYFEGKEALFLESLHRMFGSVRTSPLDPAGTPEELGERIVRRFLDLWTSEADGDPFLGILRACATSDRACGVIRRFLSDTVVPAVRSDGGAEVELRTALIGSQLFGIATARHLLRLEPLASMTNEEVARCLGPLLTTTLRSGMPYVAHPYAAPPPPGLGAARPPGPHARRTGGGQGRRGITPPG